MAHDPVLPAAARRWAIGNCPATAAAAPPAKGFCRCRRKGLHTKQRTGGQSERHKRLHHYSSHLTARARHCFPGVYAWSKHLRTRCVNILTRILNAAAVLTGMVNPLLQSRHTSRDDVGRREKRSTWKILARLVVVPTWQAAASQDYFRSDASQAASVAAPPASCSSRWMAAWRCSIPQ